MSVVPSGDIPKSLQCEGFPLELCVEAPRVLDSERAVLFQLFTLCWEPARTQGNGHALLIFTRLGPDLCNTAVLQYMWAERS